MDPRDRPVAQLAPLPPKPELADALAGYVPSLAFR